MEEQQKRTLLFMAVAMGVILGYSYFFAPPPQPPSAPAEVSSSAKTQAPTAVVAPGQPTPSPATVEAAVQPGVAADGAAVQAVQAPAPVEVKVVTLQSARVRYDISTRGGGVVKAIWTGQKETVRTDLNFVEGWQRWIGKMAANKADPVDIAGVQSGPGLGALQIDSQVPGDAIFVLQEQRPDAVVMTYTSGALQLKRTLKIGAQDGLLQAIDELTNTAPSPVSVQMKTSLARTVAEGDEEAPSFFGAIGSQIQGLCSAGEDVTRIAPGSKEALKVIEEPVHFVALDRHYFIAAAWPQSVQSARCEIDVTGAGRGVSFVRTVPLNSQQTQRVETNLYFGPKELALLNTLNGSGVEPGLEKTVDFGIWAVIAKAMLALLRLLHGVLGNWGLSIIGLTVLVKLALFPLTAKSMASTEAMRKLQPQVEALRAKLGADPAKMNQEMMKLYGQAGVNPLGGCLPMLVQIPVFIALFTALRTSYDLYNEPFFGPVWRDLTLKDPTYILPLLLGASMILQQRMMPPTGMDPMQQKMMNWLMPGMFTLMMLQLPAGLSLYSLTNNVLTIGQQLFLRKRMESKR